VQAPATAASSYFPYRYYSPFYCAKSHAYIIVHAIYIKTKGNKLEFRSFNTSSAADVQDRSHRPWTLHFVHKFICGYLFGCLFFYFTYKVVYIVCSVVEKKIVRCALVTQINRGNLCKNSIKHRKSSICSCIKQISVFNMRYECSCYKKWKAKEILSNIKTTQQVNITKLANVVTIKCSGLQCCFSNDDVISIFNIACSVWTFATLICVFYFLNILYYYQYIFIVFQYNVYKNTQVK
jgi:hypothetical protein